MLMADGTCRIHCIAPKMVMQDGVWDHGQCRTVPVAANLKVWDVVRDSLQNKPGSQPKLYFLDGTFPGELPANTHAEDMPGERRC